MANGLFPSSNTNPMVQALAKRQEVRAYKPSWRDNLAGALIGVGIPETSVEGLMGSRGLGTTDKNMGMGLVDMTPLGAPLWLNEAEWARGAGDMGGQMLNTVAAVPIPGAKAATQAVKKGIRAYHGSPHNFDKFDMSKIGTGEGAQAYGHGLYLAEAEDVAKTYKGGALEIVERPEGFMGGPRRFDIVNIDGVVEDSLPTREAAEAMIGKGRMYETRINASPDEFLDWDKPLSEQPEPIRKKLEEVWGRVMKSGDLGVHKNMSVRDFYNWLDEPGRPTRAFESLRDKLGAKGIRYLDQGSRATAGGKLLGVEKTADGKFVAKVRVQNRTGVNVQAPADMVTTSKPYATEAEAKAWADDKIGSGTRNYVVFDADAIEILRKYGLAGLMASGAGAATIGSSGDVRAGERQ